MWYKLHKHISNGLLIFVDLLLNNKVGEALCIS